MILSNVIYNLSTYAIVSFFIMYMCIIIIKEHITTNDVRKTYFFLIKMRLASK